MQAGYVLICPLFLISCSASQAFGVNFCSVMKSFMSYMWWTVEENIFYQKNTGNLLQTITFVFWEKDTWAVCTMWYSQKLTGVLRIFKGASAVSNNCHIYVLILIFANQIFL